MTSEPARAKVNLALHVVGRRPDGYHLLDTIVVFPPVGDSVSAAPAADLTLEVTGAGAEALLSEPVERNLAMRAARGLAALAPTPVGAAIRLEKRLPVAAGLGGGSADAAAAIRLLCRMWAIDPADPRVAALALSLGADVPMCMASRPLRGGGIGEELQPLEGLPDLGIVLANPGVAVSTPEVFSRLDRRDNPPIRALPPDDPAGFLAALRDCRNDLQAAAMAVAPAIGETLEMLAALPGCRLSRMSGSGATCFGLFDDAAAAGSAAARLGAARPGWWIAAAPLG